MTTFAAWPQGYRIGAGNLELYDCADSSFTGSGGTGYSTTFDAENPSPVHASGSVKCVGPTIGSSSVQIIKNVDPVVSPQAYAGVGFWVKAERTGGTGGIATVTGGVYFGSTPGDTTGGFATFVLSIAGARPDQWFFCSCPFASMTFGGGASASSFVTGTITRVIMNRFGSANEVPYWVGGIWLTARARPKLILSFDGEYDSQYTHIWPYMAARGLVGSLHISHANIGGASRMTAAQIMEIGASGWDICPHSFGFNVGYDNETTFPTEQSVIDDLVSAQQACTALGGSVAASKCLAIPITNPYSGGNTNAIQDRFASAVDAAGVTLARLGSGVTSGHQNGFSTNNYAAAGVAGREATVFTRQLHDTLTSAAALADVDLAIQLGATMTHYAHQTAGAASNGIWTEANMEAYLDGVVRRVRLGLIDVVTWSDWLRGLAQPTE